MTNKWRKGWELQRTLKPITIAAREYADGTRVARVKCGAIVGFDVAEAPEPVHFSRALARMLASEWDVREEDDASDEAWELAGDALRDARGIRRYLRSHKAPSAYNGAAAARADALTIVALMALLRAWR